MSIKIPEKPKILPLDFDEWWDEEIQPIVDALHESRVVTSSNGRDWNDEDALNVNYNALLINIEPIEKDTFEKLVKDIGHGPMTYGSVNEWRGRARKLLDE